MTEPVDHDAEQRQYWDETHCEHGVDLCSSCQACDGMLRPHGENVGKWSPGPSGHSVWAGFFDGTGRWGCNTCGASGEGLKDMSAAESARLRHMVETGYPDPARRRLKTYCEMPGCSWADWKFRSEDGSNRKFAHHLRWRHGVSQERYTAIQRARFTRYAKGDFRE